MRPADHRAGVVVHDVVEGSRHARVLRLPEPQGPLVRRARLRDVRQGARRPAVGHARARGQARRRSGRAADVPAAAGERRDGELLPDAEHRLEVHLPRGAEGRGAAGRRRLHGRRPRLPHRREGPHPARHQRDDAAPVRARAPPARHPAVGLPDAGRDGAGPPAPRLLALLRPRPPRLRARQPVRGGVPRLLPLSRRRGGGADRGPRRHDRAPRRLGSRRAGHARRDPGERVARAGGLPEPHRPADDAHAVRQGQGRLAATRASGPTAATTRGSS